VVYADIGTSQYYVPGILYRHVGKAAPFFVALTGLCFILLAVKYVRITARYAGGGGVVSAASEAFGGGVGALGGILITVGYFLTSAISAVSAGHYVSSLLPLGTWQLPATCGALGLLGLLNIIGVKESAAFSAVAAVGALGASAVVLVGGVSQAGGAGLNQMAHDARATLDMGGVQLLQGFAAAWLAFSGLESMSQLSPAMKEPRAKVAGRAMTGVTITILATSPVLTALCMVLMDPGAGSPDQFISDLAYNVGGMPLRVTLVVTAGTLLLFASNTAIIGCYHVFVALAHERYLPQSLARLNYRFGTPHNAIAVATVVPIVMAVFTEGALDLLGDLYAFGLLGAFALSAAAVDVVAWRERRWSARFALFFPLGVVTSFLVALAWGTNLWFKREATLVGGLIVLVGLGLALSIRRGWLRGEMNLVPFLTAEGAEGAAEQLPSMQRILTMREADEVRAVYPASLLVPVRGFRLGLMEATVAAAQERGLRCVYLLCVDEIPGLFYPPKVGPSPSAVQTLGQCAQFLQGRGLEPVPVWRMAHDAGVCIATAAEKLGVTAVMVGASERSKLWTVLRGSVLRGLTERLPRSIEVLLSDVTTDRRRGPREAGDAAG
jgi:amino acid transporter/nucleotide-binding universal stress UspA family protein